MPSQMKRNDIPIVNDINVENKIKIGDNLFGYNYSLVTVNELKQHHITLSVFPLHFSTTIISKHQILLEIGFFNKIAFAFTISLI